MILHPQASALGNTIGDFNLRNDPFGANRDHRDVINLADNDEPVDKAGKEEKEEDQKEKTDFEKRLDSLLYPVQSIKERLQRPEKKFDENAVRDRILTLKLMFDDAASQRKRREFLESKDNQD